MELVSVWTSVGGSWMHSRRGGDLHAGRDIVFVHGFGVSSRYLAPTARLLLAEARVHLPDLPGFGLTHGPRRALDIHELAEALGAWLAATGLHQPAIVANSMGCQIAVDLAAAHPEWVSRMVLVGPTVDPAARNAPTQLGRLLRDIRHERPAFTLVALRDYLRCGPRRLLATYRHVLHDPIERKLPLVSAPTLVVRGSHDPIAPETWAEHAAHLLPAGRLATVPGAGHAVNFSVPGPLAQLIRAFLLDLASL